MRKDPNSAMQVFKSGEEDAVKELLGHWRNRKPEGGVFALVAEQERESWVRLLQRQCRALAFPLRGAIFPALIDQDHFLERGCVLLRFNVMPFSRIYAPLQPAGEAAEEMIRRLAQEVSAATVRPRESALLLIFDAMVADIATILDTLYLELADRVCYTGVNAGSETFRPMPCLFDDERMEQNGVLAILLPGYGAAVLEHGYQAPERMISATSTEGNRIITIDWRPAFDVYREAAREEYGVEIDHESFYRIAVHFPFGIIRANGEVVVRIPVALQEDGSLFCVGEVPPNALLTLMRAPAVDSQGTVEKLAQGVEARFGSLADTDLLTFYCAGRRIHLGDTAVSELAAVRARIKSRQQAGALSLGEIGQSLQGGYPLFHNGALVCSPWRG